MLVAQEKQKVERVIQENQRTEKIVVISVCIGRRAVGGFAPGGACACTSDTPTFAPPTFEVEQMSTSGEMRLL